MEIDKVFNNDVDGVADNLFSAVKNSVSEIKAMQQRKAAENVQLVIQALKKIESDLQDKFDGVTTVIEKRVSTIKDGRDGVDGRNGRDGKDGRPGRDGAPGARGPAGVPGTDGRDGEDGVSVTDARIDFDGSLIISLSSGREINVGEVVAPDLAEKIKVITNGGGTSQVVLDTLASLQAQITAISNLGVVNYVGTWNANTNSPTITSGSGDKGDYYVVSVAGSTNIDGQTLWGVGDWIIFNGTAWQRVDGGSTGNFTTVSASGNITTGGDIFTNPDFGIFFNGPSSFSTGIFSSSDGSQMRFYAGGIVDALRLTGTGFGVFNNSPAAALDVTGTARISSTVTLSGGTANGVAYLNGSKVLTTGSALTFDGTNLTLGGYGRTSGTGWQVLNNGLLTTFGANAAGTVINNHDGGPLQFQIFSSEQMRLTSTGLGIGTSSPSSFSGYTTVSVNNATNGGIYNILVNGTETARLQAYSGIFNVAAKGAATNLTFETNGAERMRLDSSGNLGLGVTPSAWSGVGPGILELKGNAYIYSTTGVMSLGANAFFNGTNWIYKTTQAVTRYEQVNGQHQWSYAASGTAGNAISFTQAMTLDASGRLGVGTTSPSQKLTVGTTSDASNFVRVESSTAVGIFGGDAGGGYVGTDNAYALRLFTNNTERARITSGGELLVGKNSYNDTSTGCSIVPTDGATGRFAVVGDGGSSGAAFYITNTSGTAQYIVRPNGDVQNLNNSYGAISDAKLKENVTDATPKLEKLQQVRVVNFNVIGSEQKQIGVIAQELEQIFPGMVKESPDLDAEGNDLGTTTKSVKYSVFVPMLIKAIQELKAEFDAYKATHP